MKNTSVKYAEAEQAQEMIEWLHGKSDINAVDYGVLYYPATRVLVATSDREPVVYMPIQTCYVLDALGPKPELSEIEMAKALRALTTVAEWEAAKSGHGEILFTVVDDSVAQFAARHGYEELKTLRVFRKKVG